MNHRSLRAAIAPYQAPFLGCALWQVATTFLPLIAICAAMYASLALPYWVTLTLAVPAAGFVVRAFIIQHDCGHGSFFRSRWANACLGTACSLITCAPYASWRRQHAGHHAHWNNLDRRLSGVDIYSGCLTLAEYCDLTPFGRLRYRTMCHPAVSLLLLPPLVFLLLYRVPFDTPRAWWFERRAVYVTDAALLTEMLLLGHFLGFANVLAVQLPIMVLASIAGVFLFSLQHRFEGATWKRQAEWDPVSASLQSSSYLRLPKALQWFTGNIGFHHVHHLNTRVPNYRLQACHDAIPLLHTARTLTLRSGLSGARYVLWDEERSALVPLPRSQAWSRVLRSLRFRARRGSYARTGA